MSWGQIQCILLLGIGVCMGEGTAAHFGQECGDNPMKQVLMVAKRTGRTLTHVLTVLRDIDNPAYESLANKFRMYAACVGLVDTGYFRKRGKTMPILSEPKQEEMTSFSAGDKELENIDAASAEYLNPRGAYPPSVKNSGVFGQANSARVPSLDVGSHFLNYLRRIMTQARSPLDENSRYQRKLRDPELMQYVPS